MQGARTAEVDQARTQGTTLTHSWGRRRCESSRSIVCSDTSRRGSCDAGPRDVWASSNELKPRGAVRRREARSNSTSMCAAALSHRNLGIRSSRSRRWSVHHLQVRAASTNALSCMCGPPATARQRALSASSLNALRLQSTRSVECWAPLLRHRATELAGVAAAPERPASSRWSMGVSR